jgi:prepilin signal peptidase PulO-like enzyme (type II secretory pathway)
MFSVYTLITGFLFVLGLIIGSFLNVLILRYNTGKGFGGRSMCFSCGRALTIRDLFPVLSYLWHQGRCRTCKSRISTQYIIVEVLTGILFVFAYYHNLHLLRASASVFALKLAIDCSLMSIFVSMVVYDIRHKIIPDPAVVLTALLALLGHTILGTLTWSVVLSGFILAAPFYLIWLFSKGTMMGLGDAKLAIIIGWLLGISAGFTAVIFGFWLGALVSILIIISRPETNQLKRFGVITLVCALLFFYIQWYVLTVALCTYTLYFMSTSTIGRRLVRKGYVPQLGLKSEVPFAPFLITGLLIVYFLGYNMFMFTLF